MLMGGKGKMKKNVWTLIRKLRKGGAATDAYIEDQREAECC